MTEVGLAETPEWSSADLRARLERARSELDQETGQARALATEGVRLEAESSELGTSIEVHDRAAVCLRRVADAREVQARDRIEALVSRGLRSIFDEDLSFHLVPGEARGQTTVEPCVRSVAHDGSTLDTPVMSARGGGLAALIGLLLRVVVTVLSQTSDVLVLDESLSMLSTEYREPASEFLAALAHQAGVQIIMVSHQEAFSEAADVAYRFRLDVDGVTVAERL